MKSTVIWFLIGLNLLLAAGVAFRFMPGTPAQAQARRPSEYLMIPGVVSGLPFSVVYIVDTRNGTLGAMGWDDSSRQLVTIPAIDLNRVFNAAPANVQRNR